MNMALEQMTGMPMGKKKTRRGRRRGKGDNPGTHLTRCHHALKAGDHAAVKRHAFELIKSLPASERAELVKEMKVSGPEGSPSKPSAPSVTGAAKLAMALRKKK